MGQTERLNLDKPHIVINIW